MDASWSRDRTIARLGDVLVIQLLLLDCHDLIVELDGELSSDSILFITFLLPSFTRMSAVMCPDNA